MSIFLYSVFFVIVLLRLYVLKISKQHEKQLISSGGTEYDVTVSRTLAILHTLFYFTAFFEGIYKQVQLDVISILGLLLLIFSFCMLIYVIKILGQYWTVKLIFVKNHKINTHWLFKYIKHPNYFLNILPELIGVTLVFHAWITFFVFLIPYSMCLFLRIKKENQLLSLYR